MHLSTIFILLDFKRSETCVGVIIVFLFLFFIFVSKYTFQSQNILKIIWCIENALKLHQKPKSILLKTDFT